MLLINHTFTAISGSSNDGSNIVSSHPVSILNQLDGSIAEIFSDEIGTPLSNPVYSDADGIVEFWVNAGIYTIANSNSDIVELGGKIRLSPETVTDMLNSKHLRVGDLVTPKKYAIPPTPPGPPEGSMFMPALGTGQSSQSYDLGNETTGYREVNFASSTEFCRATAGAGHLSGKRYLEFVINENFRTIWYIGLYDSDNATHPPFFGGAGYFFKNSDTPDPSNSNLDDTGVKWNTGSPNFEGGSSGVGVGYSQGDVVSFAMDFDLDIYLVYINNSLIDTRNSNLGGFIRELRPHVIVGGGSHLAASVTFNFTLDHMIYPVPAGFLPWIS